MLAAEDNTLGRHRFLVGTLCLLSLLLGIVSGWLFLPPPKFIYGILNSSAMPAWVQAIGSVAAIFVAAAIPWWQEKVKRRIERQQLSIATLRLRSNLEVLGKAACDRAAAIRGFNIEAATPSTVARLLDGAHLYEASVVSLHVEKVHQFDDRIQRPILRLLEEYDQYMTEHGRIHDLEDAIKVEQFRGVRESLVIRLESISQSSFLASNAIRLTDEERRYPDIRNRNVFMRNIMRRDRPPD